MAETGRKEPNPSHGKGGGDGKAKKKESILDLSKYLDKEVVIMASAPLCDIGK